MTTKRNTTEYVLRNRGKLSNRKMARSLRISKRELLDILKKTKKNDISLPITSERSRFVKKVKSAGKRFFDSRLLPSLSLFLVALTIRLGFLVLTFHDPLVREPILDGAYYLDWGKALATDTWHSDDAYFVEPGYAYLIALSEKLFSSFLPLIGLQIFLGSLATAFIYHSALLVTKHRPASFLAALLAALSGPLVFHDALLLKTSLEFFLLSLSIFIILRAWQSDHLQQYFLAGVMIGLTAAVKANIFYAIPFLVITLFASVPRAEYLAALKRSALLLGGTLLVLSPITIRNYIASGALVPINASGGPNLYIGNWEGADGSLKPPEFVSVNPESEEESWQEIAQSYVHRPLTLSEVSSFWTKETIKQIIHNPKFFIAITAKKFLLLFHHTPFADNANEAYVSKLFPLLHALIPYWIPALFGLIGAMIAFASQERKRYFPLFAIVIAYVGTLVISHVAERYRLALLPALLVFAAALFAWVAARITERRWSILSITAITAGFLILFAFLPITASGTSVADMYVNFGAKAEVRGDIASARILYEKGLASDPLHIPSLTKLAQLELSTGNYDRAIDLFRKASLRQWELPGDTLTFALEAKEKNISTEEISRRLTELEAKQAGSFYNADYLEGMKYFRKREYKNAIPFFERALAAHPESETIIANLATAYKNGGNPDAGEKLLRRVLEQNPGNLPARFNLGNYYMGKKDYFSAIREYETINNLVPGYHLSRLYLAESYEKAGNLAEAVKTYRRFIDESRNWPEKTGAAREAEAKVAELERRRLTPGN